MPIVVKGHSVIVLCPLGVIGFTLFGGRILGFGLAFSVLIPFCGTSSLGYAVKTGLIHVNNAAIDNKDNAYIFTQPTIIVSCSRICRFVIHINAHIGIKWLSTRRRAQATVHIMNLGATCKINLLQICTLTESSISKFYVIGSHRKGFKRLCVTERRYHSCFSIFTLIFIFCVSINTDVNMLQCSISRESIGIFSWKVRISACYIQCFHTRKYGRPHILQVLATNIYRCYSSIFRKYIVPKTPVCLIFLTTL